MRVLLSLPSAEGKRYRRYSGSPLEARFTLKVSVDSGRLRRPGEPPSGGGDKRGQGHQMVPLPPLDSPKPSFALTHRRCAAKRGLRGLGSVRRFAYGTLLCPEVTLRKPPRITVRGQTVQSGSVLLRKAPLRSRMCPWSTRRPCGPLAFRRATGGSRVQRRVWGVKRGKGTIGALSPLVSAGRARHSPRHAMANTPGHRRRPMSALTSSAKLASGGAPLYRRR